MKSLMIKRLTLFTIILTFSIGVFNEWDGIRQVSLNISTSDENLGSCMVFSTYLGGSDDDNGLGCVIDDEDSIIITGSTYSTNFLTVNAIDSTKNGSRDIFITKINHNGTVVFSTYFGGSNNEKAEAIAINSNGDYYLTGYTTSSDFSIQNAYDSTLNGGLDVFITKFNADGSLNFSTYFGGTENENGNSIAVDRDGSCFITGYTYSHNFPIQNGFDSTFGGSYDAFILKLNPDGSLNFSTYLGGSYSDTGNGIGVNQNSECIVAGFTSSSNFPLKDPLIASIDSSYNGFITRLNANGSLNFSSYFGGEGIDVINDIAVDLNGDYYITGKTGSTDFPIANAYNPTYMDRDAFVSKFNKDNSLNFSSYHGGIAWDKGVGIEGDSVGACYITGETLSSNFPVQNGFFNVIHNQDAFITKFNSDGSHNFSSFLGGTNAETGIVIIPDKQGFIYIMGDTKSSNFPCLNAIDSTYNGENDVFITRLVDPMDDSDLDLIPNFWEFRMGLNSTFPDDADFDLDYDGLTNLQEFILGTNPRDFDTDDDGFSDGRDKDPLSYLVPTGWMIVGLSGCVVGIASVLFFIIDSKFESNRKKPNI